MPVQRGPDAAFAAPFVVFVPSGNTHISVPQDDTHTRFYNIASSTAESRRWISLEALLKTLGLDPSQLEKGGITSKLPGLGALGQRNVIVQDREVMRTGASYSGVPGLTVEDAIMTVSAASLADPNPGQP